MQINYETFDDKSAQPVVLVHGLGADHEMWSPQIARYPSKGFYLIVPDVRGHGRSSPVETFCIQDCATDRCRRSAESLTRQTPPTTSCYVA